MKRFIYPLIGSRSSGSVMGSGKGSSSVAELLCTEATDSVGVILGGRDSGGGITDGGEAEWWDEQSQKMAKPSNATTTLKKRKHDDRMDDLEKQRDELLRRAAKMTEKLKKPSAPSSGPISHKNLKDKVDYEVSCSSVRAPDPKKQKTKHAAENFDADNTIEVEDWDGVHRRLVILPKPPGTAGRGGFDLREKMKLKPETEPETARARDIAKRKQAFYNLIERTVKAVVAKTDLDPMEQWSNQDNSELATAINISERKISYLKRFDRHWATKQIIQKSLRNRAEYEKELIRNQKLPPHSNYRPKGQPRAREDEHNTEEAEDRPSRSVRQRQNDVEGRDEEVEEEVEEEIEKDGGESDQSEPERESSGGTDDEGDLFERRRVGSTANGEDEDEQEAPTAGPSKPSNLDLGYLDDDESDGRSPSPPPPPGKGKGKMVRKVAARIVESDIDADEVDQSPTVSEPVVTKTKKKAMPTQQKSQPEAHLPPKSHQPLLTHNDEVVQEPSKNARKKPTMKPKRAVTPGDNDDEEDEEVPMPPKKVRRQENASEERTAASISGDEQTMKDNQVLTSRSRVPALTDAHQSAIKPIPKPKGKRAPVQVQVTSSRKADVNELESESESEPDLADVDVRQHSTAHRGNAQPPAAPTRTREAKAELLDQEISAEQMNKATKDVSKGQPKKQSTKAKSSEPTPRLPDPYPIDITPVVFG
ncbi:hypothetical protein BDV93DRAFT_547974 [Ceratobasidium sp. AG-I]|nr:hypothetical protein BDV93DRAFT_547974 [Ceratobasidium sp. AG-I]